jgi:hypothetical protein
MGREFVLQQGEPQPPKKGGRRREYHAVLSELIKLKKNQRKWIHLAHYDSPTGARDALKRIRNGKTVIPEGEWEFRQHKADDGTSDLWVKYLGVGE